MFKVKVKNFDKYNPRKDLKAMSWFRLQSNINTSQTLFDLSAEGRWLWIFILCECCRNVSDTITLRIRYVNSMTGISDKKINEYILIMQDCQLLEILTDTRNELVTNTNELVTNTNENVPNIHTYRHTDIRNKHNKYVHNKNGTMSHECPTVVVQTTTTKFRKPTVIELDDYIKDMGYTFKGQDFWDYYESNGWRVGRNPMKSWQSACSTWQRNQKNKTAYRGDRKQPTTDEMTEYLKAMEKEQ